MSVPAASRIVEVWEGDLLIGPWTRRSAFRHVRRVVDCPGIAEIVVTARVESGPWNVFFAPRADLQWELLDDVPFVMDRDGRIGTRAENDAPYPFELMSLARIVSTTGLRRLLADRQKQPARIRPPADVTWIEDWEEHTADPGDGEAPFCFWWKDMSPFEVRTLVVEAFERGTRYAPGRTP